MAAPLVTGVSPKEGPPGTRVTIRGENFGRDLKDFIGKIYYTIKIQKFRASEIITVIVPKNGIGRFFIVVNHLKDADGNRAPDKRGY